MREEQLWALSRGRAIDRLLEVGLAGIGCHHAHVWCLLDEGLELVCIAHRDRDTGWRRAEGRLTKNDFPAYFNALNSESLIAAEDALTDPRTRDLAPLYLVPHGVRALLDVNLRQEGRVFGVVCFEQKHEPRAWTDEEREFAKELAAVINQLLLIDELRRRNKLLRMLNSIAPRLGQDHTVLDLARVALDTMREQFGDIWAAVYEIDTTGTHGNLLAANSRGLPEHIVQAVQHIPLAGTVLGRALASNRIVVEAMHPDDEDAIDARREAVRKLGMRTSIGIPLRHAGKVLGGIIIWLRENSWLGASELDVYESISTTVSVAFANALHLRALRHRARHDESTGLPNREQLFEDIAATPVRPDAAPLLLVLIDLREFRQINDTLGRGLADRVLVEVAGRLRAFAALLFGRVYRLAGAEFALLLDVEELTEPPGEMAPRLQAEIAAPIELAGLHLVVMAQCGIAVAPPGEFEAGQLLRRADIALGWAKHDAHGSAVYQDERDVTGPRNLELLADLRTALRDGGLVLHYQPKVDLATGSLAGCEALLRWPHPQHGNIPPDRFITVAETGNLMRELTLWVAEEAMRELVELRAHGLHIAVAINASVHNLVDDSFPDALQSLFNRYGVAAADMRLEITETVLMRDPERAMPVIQRLAGMGVALDIDDFGTGYSSLARLRLLPLAALKIDRHFIRELLQNRNDEVIVTSTAGLAHGLGLRVIAEGVEDEATMIRLRELGCDVAQGYYIGKPMPVQKFLEWVRERGMSG